MNGDLSKTPFPSVLWEIFSTHATGLLEIKKGEAAKKIFFDNGSPVNAESNLLHETLGKFLVQDRVITTAQDETALVRSLETQKPFGQALIELKAIDPATLYENLKKSFAVKILDCFSWERGNYSFTPDAKISENAQSFKMNPARLILRGIESAFPFSCVEASGILLEPAFKANSKPKIPFEEFQLNGEEVRLLQYLKKPQTLSTIEEQMQTPREATLRKLYGLTVLGLVVGAEAEGELSLDELVGAAFLQGLKPTEPERLLSETDKDTQKLAGEIAGDHMRLMALNYFEILGVPETATAVEIRDRFIEFASEYDPAQFLKPTLGEFRDRGEEIFLRGVKAYSTLSDFDTKTKYLDKLKAERKKAADETGKKKPGEAFKIQTKLLDSAPQFEQGLRLMKDRKFSKAIEFFQFAADIDSRSPSTLAHIAWCTFQMAPEKNTLTAESGFKRALELGDDGMATYLYGKFLLETNRQMDAIPYLKKAADLEPKNIDIVRELRGAERKK